ncbi:putative wall-associated receptor kinase [Helianthus annuus]|nr:putative wall-associated receptor kinase [Helianthus annuus]
MFDTMWSFLAVQQQQLLFFCARLGLEPPPPLPARPPPPPLPKLIPTRTTFSTPKTIPVPKLPPTPTPSPEPYVQPPALTLPQKPSPPLLGSNNVAHAIDKSTSLEVTKESNFGLDVEDLAEVLAVNVNNRWNFTKESSLVCYRSLEEKKTSVPLIKEDKDLVNGATRRREWRPPWCDVDTAPNANGRFEWRPPWQPLKTAPNATRWREWRPPWRMRSVLEDKDDLKGRGVDMTRTASRPVKIHFNTTSSILACMHTYICTFSYLLLHFYHFLESNPLNGSLGRLAISNRLLSQSDSYFYRTSLITPNITNFLVQCRNHITVPVDASSANQLASVTASESDLRSALMAGFNLQWMAKNDDCDKCIQSDGQCGSSSTSPELFACYCASGNISLMCNNTNEGGGNCFSDLVDSYFGQIVNMFIFSLKYIILEPNTEFVGLGFSLNRFGQIRVKPMAGLPVDPTYNPFILSN